MKRINIEVELEGVVSATSVERAKASLSQELRSEVVWVITHSIDSKVLFPVFFNALDVWHEGDEDDEIGVLDIDFYASVIVNALVPDEDTSSVLESELKNVLQDSDLIRGELESVVVTITEINS